MKQITWTKDYIDLSKTAADIVSNIINNRKHTNIGCPTGNTPIGMYHELVRKNLDWQKVNTYNLDEYCGLASGHRGSYRHYMDFHLHQYVIVNESYFPNDNYDADIANAGGLDITVLGLGHNGHIAFNEPGSSVDSLTRVVQLSDDTVKRNSEHWDYSTPFPTYAHTMGIKTIMASKSILLLVAGQAKLEILKRSLWGPITSDCPASYLQNHNNLTVLYCE